MKDKALGLSIPVGESSVIYNILDWINNLLSKKLATEEVIQTIGQAEILKIFNVSMKNKKNIIAGSAVRRGSIQLGNRARVERDGEVIFDGKVG